MEKWSYFFDLSPFLLIKLDLIRKKKHGKWIFFETKKHTAPNFSYGLTYDERLPKTFCADIFGWGQRHFCPFVAPACARARKNSNFLSVPRVTRDWMINEKKEKTP